MRNFELARLVAFAQHEPNKMPEYKPITANDATASGEAEQARARGAFIAWAMRSGG